MWCVSVGIHVTRSYQESREYGDKVRLWDYRKEKFQLIRGVLVMIFFKLAFEFPEKDTAPFFINWLQIHSLSESYITGQ
jgi:hypothetical protein